MTTQNKGLGRQNQGKGVGKMGVIWVTTRKKLETARLREVVLNQRWGRAWAGVLAAQIDCEGKLEMKTLVKISLIAAALAMLLPLASQKLLAEGHHPRYMHALSDLRFARALLQRPNGGELGEQERDAIHEIDEAIHELKVAAIEDGKRLEDHEAVDPHWPWAGRLHKAREVLNRAIGDCSKEEDNPATQGLQARVLEHLHKAHHHVDEAIAIVEHH
jgi:hypothetical protein